MASSVQKATGLGALATTNLVLVVAVVVAETLDEALKAICQVKALSAGTSLLGI